MIIGIAGGGVGGLSAALCCAAAGHKVVVLERALEHTDVGAGIQIPPNAMRVFDALGISDLIEHRAFKPEALEARMGRSGKRLFRAPLSDSTKKRWQADYLHIHRADYIQALSQAAACKSNIEIRLGSELLSYEQVQDQVHIRLADGSELLVDVLIGADGIRSKVREIMLGEDQAEFTGNIAWRAVVPITLLGEFAPAPTACVWMGRGKHAVTYRLRNGELANLVAVVECDDWQMESWHEAGNKEDALRDFEGWHPTITALLENADQLYKWGLFDRSPLDTWRHGRVALLGDAAHPMLPFLAQGAAMAVEDAWVLAHCLSINTTSVDKRLLQYQQLRQARTSKVQTRSRANASTFHRKSSLTQLATYVPMWMAGKLSPELVYRQTDWLYQYDVTKISVNS